MPVERLNSIVHLWHEARPAHIVHGELDQLAIVH